MGKKKQPVYKIVAADSKSPRDGRFIEAIGTYNPRTEPAFVNIKENLLFKWLKNGAVPTETVKSLLKREGLLLKWSLIKKNADEATIAAEMEKFQMLKAEKERKKAEKKLKKKAARKKKKAALEAPEAPATTQTA
ncbi:MAG: SSU ribosomal protein S16p [Ignavibacteriae bacterium]|nr:MAG: SSU ribosomal protein S16p [Ignavibacteriota bacterium]